MSWTANCRIRASPIIPGHEIVGRIDALGPGVEAACRSASASACPGSAIPAGSAPTASAATKTCATIPLFTGYTRDGGFATVTLADARFAFPLGGTAATMSPGAPALRRADRLALVGEWQRRRRSGWASMVSAPPRISWPRSRTGRGDRVFAFTRPGDRRGPGFRPLARRGLGRRLRRGAAGAARCRDHLRAGRRPRSAGAEGRAQGRRAWSAPAST